MSDKRELSGREGRRASRRAQILDGASRVFARKGFHAATTKEIAEAADVSEGTIYNYFDSKDDLLLQIMARLQEEEQRAMEIAPDKIEQALAVDAHDLLASVLRARQAFTVRNRPMLRAVVSQILIDRAFAERYYQEVLAPALQLLERYVQSRVDQGEIRAVNVPVLARYLVAAHMGLFQLFFLDDPVLGSTWGSDEFVEEVTDLVLQGLLEPRDRQREQDDA
jgi:AcrR family transcriptional regulator